MTWRSKIRPIVKAIIDRVGRDNVKELKRALISERPGWVSTCSWQTKIWRDEVNKQTGWKKKHKIDADKLPSFLLFEYEES
jgi:hypothetical protein